MHGFGSPEQEVTAAQEAKAPQGPGARAKAWAELLRVPAVFSVPGDALAGAAAAGVRSGRGTGWAVAASLCLYEAGMALNDWADRDEDALARPHRPLPSGRIRPGAALGAAGALTAAGLALAARAGRPALAVAAPLAATVWAYDLGLKHTKAGPAAMAAARGLDLALGAAAAAGKDAFDGPGPVISAAALATHTYAVTMVSRREAEGGSSVAPLAALGTATLLATFVSSCPNPGELDGPVGPRAVAKDFIARFGPTEAVRVAMAAAYWGTFAKPLFHAVLNPSPPLTQQAVGAGIRAMIPLQGALMARAGAPRAALVSAALAPLCAKLARKVSTT
ncbi:SCO3242 family prenyltransferase [Streptomyces sp. NPDC089919]|uniref:SCO3242 family prenyltransferase n=1 Tax=Streptomyces sp. NPDC089919 TaxID=3155188 RepID=UPI00343D8D7A